MLCLFLLSFSIDVVVDVLLSMQGPYGNPGEAGDDGQSGDKVCTPLTPYHVSMLSCIRENQDHVAGLGTREALDFQ